MIALQAYQLIDDPISFKHILNVKNSYNAYKKMQNAFQTRMKLFHPYICVLVRLSTLRKLIEIKRPGIPPHYGHGEGMNL